MAFRGVKFDDGTGSYVANCFPVRTVNKYSEDVGGAWLEAHRAEQRRQFKAIICAQPREVESRIYRSDGRPAKNTIETINPTKPVSQLDGFFLMKHCCVEDPADLCSVNISSKDLSDTTVEDLKLFDSVAYLNAADNNLKLEGLNGFPHAREIELPLNHVKDIHLDHTMFRCLEMLDLSYNELKPSDILQLGTLRKLRVLYLSGNHLTNLPENLAGYYISKEGLRKRRFPVLEILFLDENLLDNLTSFAPLAGLTMLKHLNLEKNHISAVPKLEPKTIQHDNLQTAGADKPEPIREEVEPAESQKESTDASKIEFEELDIPDLVNDLVNEDGEEEEIDEDDDPIDENDNLMPFPQLRFLSLAHNEIYEEEDLLALAAWPRLSQVHIHDNPLTNERSGDPPLITKFLTNQLGIEVTRKENPFPKKIIPTIKPSQDRKVNTKVPAIPKCDVEKLLAVEAANREPVMIEGKSLAETSETAPNPTADGPDPTISNMAADRVDEETDENGGFFMTQGEAVDSSKRPPPESYFTRAPPSFSNMEQAPPPQEVERRRKIQLPESQERMFEGYEELLYVDENEDQIQVPDNFVSTVKALQYALKHPVTNNWHMRADQPQKQFTAYKKTSQSRHKRLTQSQQIDGLIDKVRHMKTVEESPLQKALFDVDLQRKYPEAAKLLSQIQKKYGRVSSGNAGETKVKTSLVPQRAQTEIVYMVDHDTSMTHIGREEAEL